MDGKASNTSAHIHIRLWSSGLVTDGLVNP